MNDCHCFYCFVLSEGLWLVSSVIRKPFDCVAKYSRNLVSFLDKYIYCMLAACMHGSSDTNGRESIPAGYLAE